MSLWDLWREWAAGASTLDLELWGLQVRWWGRIGKVLQFAGALTVILEIVGPDRLIAFGDTLRTASPFEGVVARVRRRWEPAWAWVRSAAAEPSSMWQRRSTPTADERRTWLGLGVRAVIGIVGLVVALLFASWGWILVVIVLFGGLVVMALAAIVSFVGRLAFVAVIRPFARLISIPSLDAWAKSLGIVLVMAGFHFDLLAS